MQAQDWDDRYAAAPMMWGAEPNRTVVAEVETLPPGRAVDLACGDGRHAAWLAGRGWRVQAVDFSATAIEQARGRPETDHDRIEWVVGDALGWSPSAPVDLVVVAYLHLPALADVLRSAVGWLAPGGRLVYVGHARENLAYGVGGPSDPAVLPDVASLADALRGAYVRALQHIERETGAGTAIDIMAVASPWQRRT